MSQYTTGWRKRVRRLEYLNATALRAGHTGSPNAWVQGGNAFGATGILGTTDAQGMNFRIDGLNWAAISATGNVSLVGTGGFSATATGPGTFSLGLGGELSNDLTTDSWNWVNQIGTVNDIHVNALGNSTWACRGSVVSMLGSGVATNAHVNANGTVTIGDACASLALGAVNQTTTYDGNMALAGGSKSIAANNGNFPISTTAGNLTLSATGGFLSLTAGGGNQLQLQPAGGTTVWFGLLSCSGAGSGATFTMANAYGAAFMATFFNSSNVAGSPGIQVRAGQNVFSASSTLQSYQRPDGTEIGSVTQATSTTVAFNTTSDARAKTDIVDAPPGALSLVERMRVRRFRFIVDANAHVHRGFVAQELHEIYPDAVTVGGEDVKSQPWGVDYSKLSPIAIQAIQELSKKVAALTVQVSELQSKLSKVMP